MLKQTHKLTEEQFSKALKKNKGHFGKTARYIRQHYGIAYSRQAVRQRAKNFEGELSERLHALAQHNYEQNRLNKILYGGY
jgi:hypothetical protein